MVSGEWHRPAWGGTCRPSLLVICPGRGEDGAAARAAIWPRPGNWAARCAFGVSTAPPGLFGNRCSAVCSLQHSSGGEDVSISGWRLSGEQQTLTSRLPHVNRRLPKPCEAPKRCAIWFFKQTENCTQTQIGCQILAIRLITWQLRQEKESWKIASSLDKSSTPTKCSGSQDFLSPPFNVYRASSWTDGRKTPGQEDPYPASPSPGSQQSIRV